MAARNQLLQTPPYPIEQALKRLGENLRTARVRRLYTIEEVAQKIGTGPRAIMDAEKGKVSTGIGIYAALLWAYDLLLPFEELANPAKDDEGLTLLASRGKTRARRGRDLDNDF